MYPPKQQPYGDYMQRPPGGPPQYATQYPGQFPSQYTQYPSFQPTQTPPQYPKTPGYDETPYNIEARLDRLEREIIEMNRRLNILSRRVKRIENFLNIREDS